MIKAIHKKVLHNCEEIEIRETDNGQFICPICGSPEEGAPPYYASLGASVAFGSDEICNCCEVQFGETDLMALDSAIGEQKQIWEALRNKWLDKIGWPDWALQQLKDNLGLDVEALKRKAK